jgi:uncharacterized protein (TIGR02453 family)
MLQPSTLTYIKKLAKNNNKAWFDANRNVFEDSKNDFEKLVAQIIESFGSIDKDIAPLKAKDCTFRQYRDVRFSKDKTPYKINMGASFDRGGKKSGLAGYYLHLEPDNKSMIGGGLWMPEAQVLKKVRQEIDYSFDEFSKIINHPAFKKTFGDVQKGEYSLSREPKGYEKDNPAIEYLKLKSFVAIHLVDDEDVLSEKYFKNIIAGFTALMPFIKFINRALE